MRTVTKVYEQIVNLGKKFTQTCFRGIYLSVYPFQYILPWYTVSFDTQVRPWGENRP